MSYAMAPIEKRLKEKALSLMPASWRQVNPG